MAHSMENSDEKFKPRFATPADFPLWLNLAREMEPLFGPMAEDPEFHQGLMRCIRENRALVVADDDPIRLLGGALFDGSSNEILWLAVTNKARGRGIGQNLLSRTLEKLDPQRSVMLQTYAPGIPAGRSAISLYEKHGFIISRNAGNNPAGLPTVIMCRKPRNRD